MMYRGLIAVFFLFAFSLAAAPAGAVDFVIVKVQGDPVYKAGDVVTDQDKLVLTDKQSLTLVSSMGVKVMVKGPYTGMVTVKGAAAAGQPAKQAGKNVMSDLSKLFADESQSATALGATRNLGSLAIGPWDIPIDKQGNFCVQSDQPPMFWRKNKRYKQVLILRDEDTGTEVELAWQRKRDRLSWPTTLEIRDGGVYTARFANKNHASRLTLHLAPDNHESDLHLASWLISRDCTHQALVVIESMEESESLGGK